MEQLKGAHAAAEKSLEERHHEHMERDRKAHREHIAALEEAQRARDSREDYLKSEVERLSSEVQDLEDELSATKALLPLNSPAATTPKRRRESLFEATPYSGPPGSEFGEGTLAEAMVEEAAAEEALKTAMQDVSDAQAKASAEGVDGEEALQLAEARLAMGRVRMEKATWKRMARESQGESRRNGSELDKALSDLNELRPAYDVEVRKRESAEALETEARTERDAAVLEAERLRQSVESMQQHLSALQNGQPAPSPPPRLSDAEQAQLLLSTLTPEQQGALLAGYLSLSSRRSCLRYSAMSSPPVSWEGFVRS